MGVTADPLLRVTALYAPETTAIILTFHHAIADARSAVWILDDLMRALAGEQLKALRFSPTIEDAVLRPTVTASRLSQATRSTKCSPEMTSAAPVVSNGLRTHVVTAEFSQGETARLVGQCRANKTTVTGAICAAASRHVPASDSDTVRMVCPIDLRILASIEKGACGVFIGAGSVALPVAGTWSIWEDARHSIASIARSRSPGAVIDFMRWMSAEFPPTAQSERLRAFLSGEPQSSLVVSNLGILPMAERYGPYVVRAVWGRRC